MKLDDLRGRHKGRTAFVCGSGPSLRFFTPGRMQDVMEAGAIVFTTNSAIMQHASPTYHVVCDPACAYLRSFVQCAESVRLAILASHAVSGEVNNILKTRCPDALPKILAFPFGVESLSPDAPKVWQRNSAAASALHLAIIAGCDPIVLVGCDCSWENGKKYFYQFRAPGITDDPFVKEFAELVHPATGKPPRYIRPKRGIEGVGGPAEPEEYSGNAVTNSLGPIIREWDDVAKLVPKGTRVLNASIGVHVKAFKLIGLDVALNELMKRRIVYCDIDGTLTDRASGPWGDLMQPCVEHVRAHVTRGDLVYAWSAQGESYARQFLEYHGIIGLFHAIVDKPDLCYDDVRTIRPKLQVLDMNRGNPR